MLINDFYNLESERSKKSPFKTTMKKNYENEQHILGSNMPSKVSLKDKICEIE